MSEQFNSDDQPIVNTLIAPFTFTVGGVEVTQGTYIIETEGETLLMTREEFLTAYDFDAEEEFNVYEEDIRSFLEKLGAPNYSDNEELLDTSTMVFNGQAEA